MGMPVREDGTQENADLNLAARNALLNMIDLLQERGYTKAQAYIICSVAADLRISNVVDVPNVTVSAFISEDIFNSYERSAGKWQSRTMPSLSSARLQGIGHAPVCRGCVLPL
jgi:hypothetical protein